MNDIDDMTEQQIDEEMKRLHELQRGGQMTPRQARRLESLRIGARSISGCKRPVYWL